MRTRILYVPLLAAMALSAPAPASAASPASVKVTDCRTGKTPLERKATYRARMRAVPGSVRMRMRFHLVARSPGADAQKAERSEIGSWRRSRKGVTRFAYTQTVKGLDVGVSYRTVVKFRWYDADGKIIRRTKRTSGACTQDGQLPNLELMSVKVTPGKTPGTARYSIDIGNTGEGPALDFVVTLFVNADAEVDSRRIERIDPGETETIKFTGPACNRLRAVVDHEHSVPETIEDDNALRSRC